MEIRRKVSKTKELVVTMSLLAVTFGILFFLSSLAADAQGLGYLPGAQNYIHYSGFENNGGGATGDYFELYAQDGVTKISDNEVSATSYSIKVHSPSWTGTGQTSWCNYDDALIDNWNYNTPVTIVNDTIIGNDFYGRSSSYYPDAEAFKFFVWVAPGAITGNSLHLLKSWCNSATAVGVSVAGSYLDGILWGHWFTRSYAAATSVGEYVRIVKPNDNQAFSAYPNGYVGVDVEYRMTGVDGICMDLGMPHGVTTSLFAAASASSTHFYHEVAQNLKGTFTLNAYPCTDKQWISPKGEYETVSWSTTGTIASLWTYPLIDVKIAEECNPLWDGSVWESKDMLKFLFCSAWVGIRETLSFFFTPDIDYLLQYSGIEKKYPMSVLADASYAVEQVRSWDTSTSAYPVLYMPVPVFGTWTVFDGASIVSQAGSFWWTMNNVMVWIIWLGFWALMFTFAVNLFR